MEKYSSPQEPAARFNQLMGEFRESILDNDIAYDMVVAKLNKVSEVLHGIELPDFTLEPTLERTEAGSNIGFRLGVGRTDEVANLKVTLYEYVNLGAFNMSQATFKASPELKSHLLANDYQISDGLSMAELWQSGVRIFQEQMGNELTIDPQTHTLTLIEDLERFEFTDSDDN